MGDYQNESYKEDCRPAFAIYFGETIRNSNEQHEEYSKRFPEWYVKNRDPQLVRAKLESMLTER